MTLSLPGTHRILVSTRVDNTPDSGPKRRNHSYNSPVRAEVFNAPYGGNEDRD